MPCVLLAGRVWASAVYVEPVQRADLRALAGFTGLWGARRAAVVTAIVDVFGPAPYSVLAFAVVAIGTYRGEWRLAAAAAVLMLAANATAEILKPALETPRPSLPRFPLDSTSWPRGYTTAVTSLALALVLVVPARARPLAVLGGGALVAIVTASILVLGWHYPSDVVGGLLLSAASAWLAPSWLGSARAGRPAALPRGGIALAPCLVGGAAIVPAIVVLALAGYGFARPHTTPLQLIGAVAASMSCAGAMLALVASRRLAVLRSSAALRPVRSLE